jgi:predicted transposase YbfD/YdcC
VVFGITSLSFTTTIARQLLTWTRQHWAIENRLHYRRDVTLGEDATRMKETHQAKVVATINNFIVALANYLGFSNLASARRCFQARFDALIFSAT